MLLALPLLPMLAAALAAIARARPRATGAVVWGAMAVTLGGGVWAAGAGGVARWSWGAGLELRLAAEGFARAAIVLVPLIAAPVLVYAATTEHEGRTRLLALMSAFVGAMLLLVLAADFLTLLVAWELVGALSWALIAHRWPEVATVRAATRAFLTTRLGDLGLFVAAGLAFAATGSFAFADLGAAERPYLDAIALGVLVAAAAKSAQLPFSPWLFSAMAGPTPVSALLHSATLVAAGAYILIRLAGAFEAVSWFEPAVASLGLLTALAGGIVALLQTDAKRALAASTSAQYGLMFLAVGAGSTVAAGAHLVAHALLKALLFLGAGVAIHAAGSGDLERMRLGRALPRVTALSLVGALALAAVPPLGAAWTKGAIMAAAVDASWWLGVGALIASLLTALYAGRYQWLAYGPGDADASGYRSSALEVASLAFLAIGSLSLSLLWLPGAGRMVEAVTGGALIEGASWELPVEVLVVGLAFAMLALLSRRGRLLRLGLRPAWQTAASDWLGLPAATQVLAVAPVEGLSRVLAHGEARLIALPLYAPVLELSRALARFDDRVIDAGIRGVAAFARLVARLFSIFGEWTFDGFVRASVAATFRAASGSRVGDERLIDGAVEATARGVALAGERSRLLQAGLTHQYLAFVVASLAAAGVVLVIFGG